MKLKTKLIALNSVILFIVGTMMFLQFRAAQNKQKYEIRKGFAQSADKLQRNISSVFYLYYHNVQNIALNRSLKTKNFDEINFYFNELVSLYPLYNFIIFVDKEGKFIASNNLDGSGKKLDIEKLKQMNFSSEEWFKSLKEGKLVENYEKKLYGSYFGPYHQDKIVGGLFNDNRAGNYFSTPVNDEFGDLVGYLSTFVNGNWVTNELLNTNKELLKEGKEGAKIFVLNNTGNVLSEVSHSKYTDEHFLKLNVLDEYKNEIEHSKTLKEPSFFEAMFQVDNSPLYAYSEFNDNKFVDAIGWKAFVEMESESAFSAISVASNIFSTSFIFILLIGSLMALLVSNKLSNNLLNIANRIADGSINISDASGKLSDHSTSLSSATSEQASSLQETVASLNEISAMINKNTDASQTSKELSSKSRSAAELGKGTINKMIDSIDDISQANSEIINQMNKNAAEIQEIITVIKEIEDKTKVINDIVFQTKLLSFNASVEAARAGEHGKGFSVVAEEVGNLAQHSGDAAKQIEEMLVQSVNRVEAIARNTDAKVQDLIAKGTSKVEHGKNVANQCDSALGEILGHVNKLDNMIEEIAIASVEQSQGVQEITKAMSELDKVTKQNSMIAHETSLNTQSLNEQAKGLKDISISLTDLITGEKNSNVDFSLVEKRMEKKTHFNDVEETSHAKVISLNSRKVEKTDFSSATNKTEERQIEVKKVASSDLSVPPASDGEWEDI